MPQMKPMNWMMITFSIYFIILFININLYYLMMKKINYNKMNLKLKIKNWTW